MDATVREKIKRIKIATKRAMQSSLAGDYLSAFKGTGLEFDQIREYVPGDDIRFIDWHASAKSDNLMVKEFVEERDRTLILAIDISSSLRYSSTDELKKDLVAQVAASLVFIARQSNDKIGVLFFSDHVEKWIPPSRGSAHITQILKTIFTLQARNVATNIRRALEFVVNIKKRGAIFFCISDWIEQPSNYEKLLPIVRCGYDFVGVRIRDEREADLPSVGILACIDSESGRLMHLATSGSKNKQIRHFLGKRLHAQQHLFVRNKVDLLDLQVGESFVQPMIRFFHERTRRQI